MEQKAAPTKEEKLNELYRKKYAKPFIRSCDEPITYKQVKEFKEFKALRAQNLDRIFLKIDDPKFQSINFLSEQDVTQLKLDRREYVRELLIRHRQIFPDELIQFNWKRMCVRPKQRLSKDKDNQPLKLTDLGLEKDKSDEEEDNNSGEIYDEDFGARSDLFEESGNEEGSYGGDGAQDDYD